MPIEAIFPPLDGFEPTRQTLQLYSRAVSAISRAYGDFHPQWWHVSLKVHVDGLVADEIRLPDGDAIRLKVDLIAHEIVLLRNGEPERGWDMTDGMTSTALGNEIIAAVEEMGLSGGDYAREKFKDDAPRAYDPEAAARFLVALTNADRIFKEHRSTLHGKTSPVQLWPHGFDLAFEWLGTRVETYEEDGEVGEHPAQLNLGFYPAEPAYFYSNPWPFEADELLDKPLPEGASWHTEGWQGTILPYAELANDPNAEARLRNFARVVYETISPTLMAT